MLQGGATIINEPHGTWNLTTGPIAPHSSSSGGTFNNEGALATTGTDVINVTLDNSGSLAINSGTLTLGGGGSASSSGGFTVAASTTLDFNSSYSFGGSSRVSGEGSVTLASGTLTLVSGTTYDVTGGLTGTGGSATFGTGDTIGSVVSVSAGTVVFGAGTTLPTLSSVSVSGGVFGGTLNFSTGSSVTITTLTLTNGTVTGSDSINVTGTTTWKSNSTLSGSGTVISDGILNISSPSGVGSVTLIGRTLENFGTASFQGASNGNAMVLEGGATVINEPQHTWNFTTGLIEPFSSSSGGTFSNQGTLDATGTEGIGVALDNSGTVDVTSGTLSVTGGFTQTGTVSIASGGTLSVKGAYTQSSGSTTVAGGGTLTSTTNTVAINGGTLSGSGTVNGNVTNAGNIIPGGVGAAGILTISGTYTQTSGGNLTIYLSGTTAGTSYGQLEVTGAASLGGHLNLDIFGGYVPNGGDAYQVLTSGADGGQFANVNPVGFPDGTTVTTNYNPTDVLIAANVPQPVDFTALGDALEGDLSTIQGSVADGLKDAVPIPIIGQDLKGLTAVTNGLGLIVEQLVNALESIQGVAANSPKLGGDIQAAVLQYMPAYNPNEPNNGTVTLADLNDQNGGTVESNDVLFTQAASNNPDHTFSVEVLLTVTSPTSIAFSLGLGSFLTLSAGSDITLDLTTDYLLSFTFDPASNALSLDNTVSLAGQADALQPANAQVTLPTTLPATPVAIGLSITPDSSSLGGGQFAGFLQAHVSDLGSHFSAYLGVGLDADNGATLSLSGDAAVNIQLSLDFGSNVPLDPTITTGLSFGMGFDDSSLGGDPADFGVFTEPITFDGVNVSITLGILGKIIADIQQITEPIQPIINILNAQVPGLDAIGIKETLVGLFLDLTGNSSYKPEVDAFFSDITLINSLDTSSLGNAPVSLPVLKSVVISDPRAGTPFEESDSDENATPDPSGDIDSDDSELTSLDAGTPDGDPALFSFPIFSNPAAMVIPLLLGTASTANAPDLFTFQLMLQTPTLGASIPVGSIPPFVPVIKLDLGVALGLSVAGGYDLAGLIELAQQKHPSPSQIAGDVADGFYIDDYNTYITLDGSIGLEADAYIVSITGTLSLDLSLWFADPDDPSETGRAPMGSKTRLDQLGDFSLGQLFKLGGSIDLEFSINVGIELGFVNVNVFSINIGPFVLVSFDLSSGNTTPSTAPTIFLNENNTAEKISVHQTTYPDPSTANQTDEAIEVDYPNQPPVLYPTGAINTTTHQPISPDPWPTYTQIVTITNGNPFAPEMQPSVLSRTAGQSIDIASDVTSYNHDTGAAQPINAVLIGGEGDDDLEYDASGNAMLIGNGGNNTLIGGGSGTVYAYADTIDPEQPDPLLSNPAWFSQLPAWLQDDIVSTEGEVGVPDDFNSSQTLAGAGNGDFLEGGAGENQFEENGDNFAVVTEGNVSNSVQVASASTSSGSGQTMSLAHNIYFTNTEPGTYSPSNVLGLSPDATDDLVLSGLPATEFTGPYLQVAGTETTLYAFGDVQYVSVALQGGTLEIGDMSALPTLAGIIVDEDSGLFSSEPLTPGDPNTITLDPPSSGAPAAIQVGGIPVSNEDAQDNQGFPSPTQEPFYDLDVLDTVTNTHVIFQGLTDQDTVNLVLHGGTAVVQPPNGEDGARRNSATWGSRRSCSTAPAPRASPGGRTRSPSSAASATT